MVRGVNFLRATGRFASEIRKLTLAIDRTERRVLFKMGAYTRKVAKRSIRKRKSKSAAGSPPSSHVGTLRNNIWFAVRPEKVIIGPSALRFRNIRHLEYGGVGLFYTTLDDRGLDTAPVRSRVLGSSNGTFAKGRFNSRPFMRPAAAETLKTSTLASIWRNALR